ncbi:competence protein ComK [Sediminibacillus halophilus]|uniref:Competence protein ComK n=1 Tax=Sediminibacillus halophilus TaxID=482461 RepID=A0A1G9UEK0_9BACI|nr:competence protein ComK [Sediminibacillus halophilus]SDM58332.1 competence protein ComK [Sediminibacillus halophilus]
MKKVQKDYKITKQTMALLTACQMEYETVVIERNRQLYIKRPPLQLIKNACLNAGSSYDGRRSAVIYHTGSKKKVPIPVSPENNIFAFPTCSPDTLPCNWIFLEHIFDIKSIPKKEKNSIQSIIVFHNGVQLQMKESKRVLEKQFQRTVFANIKLSSHMKAAQDIAPDHSFDSPDELTPPS